MIILAIVVPVFATFPGASQCTGPWNKGNSPFFCPAGTGRIPGSAGCYNWYVILSSSFIQSLIYSSICIYTFLIIPSHPLSPSVPPLPYLFI